jgi:hypothetical protein
MIVSSGLYYPLAQSIHSGQAESMEIMIFYAYSKPPRKLAYDYDIETLGAATSSKSSPVHTALVRYAESACTLAHGYTIAAKTMSPNSSLIRFVFAALTTTPSRVKQPKTPFKPANKTVNQLSKNSSSHHRNRICI